MSHGVLAGPFLVLGWAAHDERPGNQQRSHDTEHPKSVLIAQHGRLPQQLLVGVPGGCGLSLGSRLSGSYQSGLGLGEKVLVAHAAGDEICRQR